MGRSISQSATSPTLLGRVRRLPYDPEAWDEFLHRYTPKILGWCRRWNLQPADVEDVTQEVLQKMLKHMRSFEYDPAGSFRRFLRTVTHNAWCDFIEARKSEQNGSESLDALDTAGGDLLEQVDQQAMHDELIETMGRVRLYFEPRSWDAFILTAMEGRSPSEVAFTLGMTANAVYTAKSKITRKIKEELRKLAFGAGA